MLLLRVSNKTDNIERHQNGWKNQANSKLVEEEYKVRHAKLSAWCSQHCARGMDYKQEKCIITMGLKKL